MGFASGNKCCSVCAGVGRFLSAKIYPQMERLKELINSMGVSPFIRKTLELISFCRHYRIWYILVGIYTYYTCRIHLALNLYVYHSFWSQQNCLNSLKRPKSKPGKDGKFWADAIMKQPQRWREIMIE